MSGSEGCEVVLVLSRRTRDSIMIGHDIVVTVLSIGRDQVRLGIVAPSDVEVHREEVYRSIQQANRAAAASQGDLSQLAQVRPVEHGSGIADPVPGPGGTDPGCSSEPGGERSAHTGPIRRADGGSPT